MAGEMNLPERAATGRQHHSQAGMVGLCLTPALAEDMLADPSPAAYACLRARDLDPAHGMPSRLLAGLAQRLALSIHDDRLPVGGEAPLDPHILADLKAIVLRHAPFLVSLQLAWSQPDQGWGDDPLPALYDRTVLDRTAAHVDAVQSALARPVLLENPSAYIGFETCTMRETDFLREVARKTGCGLRLDLGRAATSAGNHGFPPERYIDEFPLDRVEEIRIGRMDRRHGDLFQAVLARTGPLPSLIEGGEDATAASLKTAAALVGRLLAGNPGAQHRTASRGMAH